MALQGPHDAVAQVGRRRTAGRRVGLDQGLRDHDGVVHVGRLQRRGQFAGVPLQQRGHGRADALLGLAQVRAQRQPQFLVVLA
jgi:hypothetical protein